MAIIDRFNAEALLRSKGSTIAHLDRSAKTAQTIRGKKHCDHEWHLGLGEKGIQRNAADHRNRLLGEKQHLGGPIDNDQA